MLLRILAFFKWVYGNPLTFLVGIRRIPAYHVDYTTGSRVIRFQIKSVFSIFLLGTKCQSMESIESTAVKMPGETLTLSCRASGSQVWYAYHLVVRELRLVVRRGISELNINQAACPPKRFFL